MLSAFIAVVTYIPFNRDKQALYVNKLALIPLILYKKSDLTQ